MTTMRQLQDSLSRVTMEASSAWRTGDTGTTDALMAERAVIRAEISRRMERVSHLRAA